MQRLPCPTASVLRLLLLAVLPLGSGLIPCIAQGEPSKQTDATEFGYAGLKLGDSCTSFESRLLLSLQRDGYEGLRDPMLSHLPRRKATVNCLLPELEYEKPGSGIRETLKISLDAGAIWRITRNYRWKLDAGPSKRSLLAAMTQKFGPPTLLKGNLLAVEQGNLRGSQQKPPERASVLAVWLKDQPTERRVVQDLDRLAEASYRRIQGCLATGEPAATCSNKDGAQWRIDIAASDRLEKTSVGRVLTARLTSMDGDEKWGFSYDHLELTLYDAEKSRGRSLEDMRRSKQRIDQERINEIERAKQSAPALQ